MNPRDLLKLRRAEARSKLDALRSGALKDQAQTEGMLEAEREAEKRMKQERAEEATPPQAHESRLLDRALAVAARTKERVEKRSKASFTPPPPPKWMRKGGKR